MYKGNPKINILDWVTFLNSFYKWMNSTAVAAPAQEPNDSVKTTAPAEEPKKEEKK